jgi:hypothetical protein
MENADIQDETSCYGYHIPEGSLVLYDAAKAASDTPRASVSTLEIAPGLLANFGVDRPGYMIEPTSGLMQ